MACQPMRSRRGKSRHSPHRSHRENDDPSIDALEPIKPLLAVCHKRTGTAQKNAAIACARLASHPKMLETLKANNGLELIYRYVQP